MKKIFSVILDCLSTTPLFMGMVGEIDTAQARIYENMIKPRNKCFLKGNFQYLFFLFVLTGLFFLVFPSANSFGRDVSFSWTANTDDPPVNGYRLYYKTGDPGSALGDYNGTDANGLNPSPIQILEQATATYLLQNLLDSEIYSFVLTAYRGAEESTPTSAITMDPVAPPVDTLRASISTSTLTGESPLPVTFNATASTGNIEDYEWIFGDGSTGTGSMTTHTFSAAGTYTVTLTVTDNLAATDQAAVSIVVTNPPVTNNPPTAVISSSSSIGPAPLSVEFDGSASTDNDGNILSYEWDFGDGASASGSLVNHTYSAIGTFTAMLTVTDDEGLTDSTTIPVQVSESAEGINIPPTAVIATSTGKGYAPLAVSFNAGESYDSDGNIESYTWSFGDGTISTGVNVTHKFLHDAVYKVTLQVKDDKGAVSLPATYTVTVLDKDQQVDSVAPLLTAIYLLLGE